MRRWLEVVTFGFFGVLVVVANPPSLWAEFQINSFTTGSQSLPAVSHDSAGAFGVVWEDGSQDGYGAGVFGQRFDSGGNPLGGEFQVNSFTTIISALRKCRVIPPAALW